MNTVNGGLMAGTDLARLAVAMLWLAAPVAAQTRSVTLEEAVARASRVQPRVIQATGQVRTARHESRAPRVPISPT